MKKFIFYIFTISVLLFANSASAIELYSCTDRDGNKIVTSAPQDGMNDCVLKESDEDISPKQNVSKSQKGTSAKRASNPECNSVSGIMNSARQYLNQAANRSKSEMEAGREDVKQALPYLEEAETLSRSCNCPEFSSQVATAAQFARQATYVNVVSIFSDYLTRSISAFNSSYEAFNNCR